MTAEAFRRILLVGFMASGKSVVGREVAKQLDWDFLDFDQVVQEEAGTSIEVIFRERGEAHFRLLEAEVGERLLRRDRVVLASGGGWAVAPGRMEELGADTLSVWLKVSAATAIRRAGGSAVRPLLDPAVPPADRLRKAERLLRAREPFYEKARIALDTEAGAPSDLAAMLIRSMRGGRRATKRTRTDT